MKRTQLITTEDLSRAEVDFLIEEAEKMRKKGWTEDLKGRVVATLFFEPSTRTRLSFESAALRLGGRTISVADASTTSAKKGETLADTIRVFDKLADVIVMRQPVSGATAEAAKYTEKPVINGGDGSNQHPSQALLDMLTFHREMDQQIDGKTFAFVGDLKFGRTVHSILYLLAQYNARMIFISPKELALPQEYRELLKQKNIPFTEDTDLVKHLPDIDVLYMTRIQQERFVDPQEYQRLKGCYVLTAELVRKGKPSLRVMHPLPRIDEITTDVDPLPQAAYFREVENGLYMRMAILKTVCRNYYASASH
ncbi:aspartate carbamoyltransferase [Candidatus Peregrinibacteria bacterium]|nr:aspartate carbamoyltransferase [Candidatus Peregrinibacteria bacterium]